MQIHVFIKLFLKVLPLLEELLLKDKTFVEFFSQNKLSFFLLSMVIILSLSLYNSRNKAILNPVKTNSEIIESYLPSDLVNRNGEEPQPPKPEYTQKPQVLIREDEEIRQLIRSQLVE